MTSKILSIAGSDSSGGAGIQADIATISKLGGVAMTAITAVTSQDENKVYDVHYLPIYHIQKQIEVVINRAQAIKTGMLCNAEVINVISELLPDNLPIIIDPVMVSTSGYKLLSKDAVQIMKDKLFAKASLLTPNIPEAELLVGRKISNTEEMIIAGKEILSYGMQAVLMKGGHLIQKNTITDILITKSQVDYFTHNAIYTQNTHGTGCKLSAAIAYYIIKYSLQQSVQQAIDYVVSTL